jgi:hypothetical protein
MTDYRTQDPEALRQRITWLESENRRLSARPVRRRPTVRAWLLLVHFVFLVIAMVGLQFGIKVVGVPALAWSVLALAWQFARSDKTLSGVSEGLLE